MEPNHLDDDEEADQGKKRLNMIRQVRTLLILLIRALLRAQLKRQNQRSDSDEASVRIGKDCGSS